MKDKNCLSKVWRYTIYFVLLVMCFQTNGLRTVKHSHFASFQNDSQALVVGRLIYSEQKGALAGNGFLGFVSPVPDENKKIHGQYQVYERGGRVDSLEAYYSHPGGQGMCYYGVSCLVDMETTSVFGILQLINSIFTALIFLVFLIWVQRISGSQVAIGVLVCILFCSWIVMFSRNLYWVLGVFYLAFVTELWVLERNRRGKEWKLLQVYGLVFITVSLKGWLTGFEYISTYVIMTVIPFVFYAIWQRWPMSIVVARLGGVCLVIFVACVLIMGVLLFQLVKENGTFTQAIEYIVYTFGKRSYGIGDTKTYVATIQEGVGCSLSELLYCYWKSDMINLKHWFDFPLWKSVARISYGQITLVFLGFSFWTIYKIRKGIKGYRLEWALMPSLWLSLLAPLSWFILFKSHSYVHLHMNNIVWQMPYVLWGVLFIGVVIKNNFNHEKAT